MKNLCDDTQSLAEKMYLFIHLTMAPGVAGVKMHTAAMRELNLWHSIDAKGFICFSMSIESQGRLLDTFPSTGDAFSLLFSLGSDSFIIHSTFNAIFSAGLMWCWWSENFYFYPEFPRFASLTLHQQIVKEYSPPSFAFTFIPSQKQSVLEAAPAKLCLTQSRIYFEVLSL